jgi:DNA replication regulator DPB11
MFHRLPIFTELVIALSGIDDSDRQKQVNRLVTYNKGIFVENIERPVKVTHLLCSGDEKTEKMKYAEKFNKLGEADIKLVWEEWFWDCIHFGGTNLACIFGQWHCMIFVSRSLAGRQVFGDKPTA